jgi:hypothetical protein
MVDDDRWLDRWLDRWMTGWGSDGEKGTVQRKSSSFLVFDEFRNYEKPCIQRSLCLFPGYLQPRLHIYEDPGKIEDDDATFRAGRLGAYKATAVA